jgi:hypothetical protein
MAMDAWAHPTLLPTCMTRYAASLSCKTRDLTAECSRLGASRRGSGIA